MSKPFPIPLSGGVNLHDDPLAIQDGQWQRLRNLAPRKNGVLGQRPSLSFVREVIPTKHYWDIRLYALPTSAGAYHRWAQWLRPVQFLFDPNFGEFSMVAVTTAALEVKDPRQLLNVTAPENTLLFINLPQSFSNSGGNSVLQAAVLGEAGAAVSMFVFNGTTYVFDGGQSNGVHLGAETADAVPQVNYISNDFGTGNPSFKPQGACVVRDRVLYYKGPNIYFSDRNEPLVIGSTGTLDADGNIEPSDANPVVGTNFNAEDTRGIFLGGEELENITAVAEVNTSADGSPIQSVAMVFTGTHAYMLLGEPLETTEGGDVLGSLQINRLNVQAGCISQATVTRTPYGTFWLGADDVWFMPFGSLPVRVGTSIRPLIQAQPPGLLWKLHAEYDDGFYKLSLFKDGQGAAIYDPCGMQMWLDLRSGGPQGADSAKWYGPQEFVNTDGVTYGGAASISSPAAGGVFCMARDTRANGDKQLYCLQTYGIYTLDVSQTIGMSLCSLSTYEGHDTTAPQYPVSTPWAAATGYGEGDIFVPTPRSSPSGVAVNAPIWVCTATGTSHATDEPDWFWGGGTLTDGTVTWKLRFWDATDPLSAHFPQLLQGSNQIEWSMLSKEFALGDMMIEKMLDGGELAYWAKNPTQLTYNSHPKQDSRSRILTPELVGANNLADTSLGERAWQRKLLTADPTKRFKGLTATWECGQDAGYIITTGVNDTIRMGINFEPASTITIAAGYYADIGAVMDAIVAAGATAVQGSTPAPISIESTYGVDGGYERSLVGFRAVTPGDSLEVRTADEDEGLPRLLGYALSQEAVSLPTAVSPLFCNALNPVPQRLSPDMQLSALNLRFRTFGRRPS